MVSQHAKDELADKKEEVTEEKIEKDDKIMAVLINFSAFSFFNFYL